MEATAGTSEGASPPWHAAYPKPEARPMSISREELLKHMREGALAGKDFLLVDLRRMDLEGGIIAGSINLPAQSLHPTLPTIYNVVKAASIRRVIWFCGSSRGRGTRAAAWFADYLNERQEEQVESVVLDGGIAGWVAGGGEFVERMCEFDASKWGKS